MGKIEYVPLNVERIRRGLSPGCIHQDLRYFSRVDSTNRVARDLPPGSWKTGTVILTDYQHAGRGRQGRSWLAPAGSSLLCSCLFQIPPAVRAADLTMVAALAVADAVSATVGLDARLKWPNDVLLKGRKVCGILAESTWQGTSQRVIVGMGINVNFSPTTIDGIPPQTTSLQEEVGYPVERDTLAVHLFNSLDMWYRSVTLDPDVVFAGWESRLDTVGSRVLVSANAVEWQGTAIGVKRDGGLLVRDDRDEIHTVYAADVSVRKIRGCG